MTWWSKPADVKVWDYPHWIAHISFDGLAAGTYTATELFKTFKTPGQGKIIALQGRLGDTPNAERWEGLQQVLPKIPGSSCSSGNLRNGIERRPTTTQKRCWWRIPTSTASGRPTMIWPWAPSKP